MLSCDCQSFLVIQKSVGSRNLGLMVISFIMTCKMQCFYNSSALRKIMNTFHLQKMFAGVLLLIESLEIVLAKSKRWHKKPLPVQDKHWPAESLCFCLLRALVLEMPSQSVMWSLHKQLCRPWLLWVFQKEKEMWPRRQQRVTLVFHKYFPYISHSSGTS